MQNNESLSAEFATFVADFGKAEKEHENYLHQYREMIKHQNESNKHLKHLNYCYKQLSKDIKRLESKKAKTPEDFKTLSEMKPAITEIGIKISEMERELPASSNGL